MYLEKILMMMMAIENFGLISIAFPLANVIFFVSGEIR